MKILYLVGLLSVLFLDAMQDPKIMAAVQKTVDRCSAHTLLTVLHEKGPAMVLLTEIQDQMFALERMQREKIDALEEKCLQQCAEIKKLRRKNKSLKRKKPDVVERSEEETSIPEAEQRIKKIIMVRYDAQEGVPMASEKQYQEMSCRINKLEENMTLLMAAVSSKKADESSRPLLENLAKQMEQLEHIGKATKSVVDAIHHEVQAVTFMQGLSAQISLPETP